MLVWTNQICVLMNLQLFLKRTLFLKFILDCRMISKTLWTENLYQRNFELYLGEYVFSKFCKRWHKKLFLPLCELGRDWEQWSTNCGKVVLAFAVLHPGTITTKLNLYSNSQKTQQSADLIHRIQDPVNQKYQPRTGNKAAEPKFTALISNSNGVLTPLMR